MVARVTSQFQPQILRIPRDGDGVTFQVGDTAARRDGNGRGKQCSGEATLSQIVGVAGHVCGNRRSGWRMVAVVGA